MKIKWMRYNRKKIFLLLFLFLLLIEITIGYALASTKLSVLGTINIKDAKWDIHFTNFNPINGSVDPTESVSITNTNISFDAKFTNPSDFYSFTVDVVNSGTIDAIIDDLSIKPDVSGITYIDYTVSYSDGTPITVGDILKSGSTKKIKVYLNYIDDLDDLVYPVLNQIFDVNIKIDYVQCSDKVSGCSRN